MTRRSSTLSCAESGTSSITSGVANSGTISGAGLLLIVSANAAGVLLHFACHQSNFSTLHLCAVNAFNSLRDHPVWHVTASEVELLHSTTVASKFRERLDDRIPKTRKTFLE